MTRRNALPLLLPALVSCGGRTDLDVSIFHRGSEDASTVHLGTGSPSSDASTELDAGFAPPSCQPDGPGMTNCGAATESCCTSVEISGGTFYRTYDPLDDAGLPELSADGGPTGMTDPATVSSFRLDIYDVTVGRFRSFVNAVLPPDGGPGYMPPAGSGKHAHLNGGRGLENGGDPGTFESGWDATWNQYVAPSGTNLDCGHPFSTWTNAPRSQENLPINCVNWYEAYAFCIWDGSFLPSEAEWEYAAAGGGEQREYPWGSTAPGTMNQYAIYEDLYPPGGCSSFSNLPGVDCYAPVGTTALGAGLWGQFDLAGEVYQWNLDWYAAYIDPCVDCAYLAEASTRVTRGGDNASLPPDLMPPRRNYSYSPMVRFFSIGVRCARSP